MEKVRKFKTNVFYYYAVKYAENLTSDAEIKNIDMTKEFWREIENEIKADELVDININAKVRMSKSTTGIYIGREIYKLLIKHKKRKDKTAFGMKNIARDQQEYSKIMRNPKTAFTVVVTDEINELEQTGENVTVERALTNVFSNVQAGRYVHRVSCSPKETADPNADIFLEVISVDRKNKITHAHLWYKTFKGGVDYMQLLGYVNFDVSGLIDTWDNKVKKHFLKAEKNRHDLKVINEWGEKDFYTNYMIKKYEKMELITKEGILRPRLLDYAEIILKVEGKLRKLAKINVLNKDTIKNYVKMYCRKNKIPTSIVGEELMTQEVNGILSLWKSYYKICKDRETLKLKRNMGKVDQSTWELKEETLREIGDELMETIQAQIEEMERYREINEEYNK